MDDSALVASLKNGCTVEFIAVVYVRMSPLKHRFNARWIWESVERAKRYTYIRTESGTSSVTRLMCKKF